MATNLQALLTQEGLNNTQDAQLSGRYIELLNFGISEIAGSFDETRSIDSLNTMWVDLPISGSLNISPNTQQLNLTIPPNVINPFGVINNSNKELRELYLFGATKSESFTVDIPNNELIVTSIFYNLIETGNSIRLFTDGSLPASTPETLSEGKTFYVIKSSTNRIKLALTKQNSLDGINISILNAGTGNHKIAKYFLFSFGQFTPEPLVWVSSGALTLRIQLVISNLNIPQQVNFTYTQANEIKDHNVDPNAHPYIINQLATYGIYLNKLNFEYKNQNLIINPAFHLSVDNDMVVYKKASDGKFYPAIANAGEVAKVVGVADKDDNLVRTGGIAYIPHSIPVNQDVYLSDNVAGAVTSSITSVKLGRSLGNNLVLWLYGTSGSASTINYLSDLNDVIIDTPQNRQFLKYNATTSVWNNSFLQFSDIGDFNTDTPASDKQAIIYDGSTSVWKPTTISFGIHSDIEISGLSNNDILKYNATASKWVNTQFGLTFGSLSGVFSNVQFGSGFDIVDNGSGQLTISYTGTGSSNFTGLTDVPDSYPSKSSGLVVFDNLTSNTSAEKIRFIDSNTSISDGVFAHPDGAIYNSVLKAVVNFQTIGVTFPLSEHKFFVLSKGLSAGANSGSEGIATWIEPSSKFTGSSISNVTSGQNYYATKFIFGAGISGSYNVSTNELTLTASGGSGGGLTSVSPASSTYSGNRPLIYDTGASTNIAKLRGLSFGTNIEIEMRDSSNAVTTNVNNAVYYILKSSPKMTNISNTGGLVSSNLSDVVVNNVLMPVKPDSNYALPVRGIRGSNGINARLETVGSLENIVLELASGSGGGLAVGSTTNINSGTGLTFNVTNTATGFRASGGTNKDTIGYYSSSHNYAFSDIGSNIGLYLSGNVTGIKLDGNITNPITFVYKSTPVANSNTLDDGTMIYANVGGRGQDLYFKIGSIMKRILTTNT